MGYGYRPDGAWGTDPLYLRNSSGFYFYHNDHLGTPFKLTAVDGSVVWSAMYDAYGKASVDAASTVTNNLRLPGQYYDAETRLHYNWQRYYDPAAGRYLSEDPIGIEGGLNLYHYTYQDPVNLSDPTGEFVPAIAVSYARCFATCQLTNAAASATGQCEFYTASCAASCANPMNWLRIGPRVVPKSVSPTTKQLEKFQKQLQEHGRTSLERSQRKIERRLNEHKANLERYRATGGHTSSVEREIRNFERRISDVDRYCAQDLAATRLPKVPLYGFAIGIALRQQCPIARRCLVSGGPLGAQSSKHWFMTGRSSRIFSAGKFSKRLIATGRVVHFNSPR